jgi:fatty acid desaturase
MRWALSTTVRLARGRFLPGWETALFPEAEPEKRRRPIRWARFLLIGHGAILVVAVLTKVWLLPVVISLSTFYGGWLFFCCNNTQHIGLQDNVNDFRLCCRTFTVNPLVQFLYWHMNFHTEHHMYAAVPCYNLSRLHRAIREDLPPCPHGIIATWVEIARIQKAQAADPGYQFCPALPVRGESTYR